jgi:hypothetical protein
MHSAYEGIHPMRASTGGVRGESSTQSIDNICLSFPFRGGIVNDRPVHTGIQRQILTSPIAALVPSSNSAGRRCPTQEGVDEEGGYEGGGGEEEGQ